MWLHMSRPMVGVDKTEMTYAADREIKGLNCCNVAVSVKATKDEPSDFQRVRLVVTEVQEFSNDEGSLQLFLEHKVLVLGKQLKAIDEEEATSLFLGSSRGSTDYQREFVLLEMESALTDYCTPVSNLSQTNTDNGTVKIVNEKRRREGRRAEGSGCR